MRRARGGLLTRERPGQSAYDFQRLNASMGAAPSVDTLKRRITELVGDPLRNCGFTDARFEAAMQHFDRLGYKANAYLLVNDATSLLPALGYNASTDEVLGFALSDEEMARLDIRAGDTVSTFLDRFDAKKLATQVEIYLLVPLAPRVPPFILGAFAQSGTQVADTVKRRLDIARAEVERRGGLVLAWAADGATTHVNLMRSLRARRTLDDGLSIEINDVPTLLSDETAPRAPDTTSTTASTTVWLPARPVSIKGKTTLVPETPIFDPVHLVNLLRNALLRKNAAMKVGAYGINLSRLRDLLAQKLNGVEKVEITFGVRHTDWAVTDRMNYAAAQRLFSTKLLDFVEMHFGNECRGAWARGGTCCHSHWLPQERCSIFVLATACCAPFSTRTLRRTSASSLPFTPCL